MCGVFCKVNVMALSFASCFFYQVPNFSPRDVIENLRRRMNGQAYVEMQPWYDGFAGTIEVQYLYSMSACLQ